MEVQIPLIVMPFGLWARTGPSNHELYGGPDRSPNENQKFWGKGLPIVKYGDFLPWAVQKQLNRLICNWVVDWGLPNVSRVQSYSPAGTNAHMGGHIGATWRIWLNHPSVVSVQSYVKLLWPLVKKFHRCGVLLDSGLHRCGAWRSCIGQNPNWME